MSRAHLDTEALARLAEGDRRGLDEDAWRHLATCRACNATFLETVEILHRWRTAPGDLPAPAALLAAGHRVAAAVAAEQERPGLRRWDWRAFGIRLGGLAIAGSLAVAMLLPPRPTELTPTLRGGAAAAFTQPVEGELLVAERGVLAWTPVPQATLYRVQLRDDGGLSVWEASTAATSIRLPAALELKPGRRYRALLAVQPADLLAPGRVSVSFRAGSAWARALHQVRWPDRRAQLLAVAGVIVLGISLSRRDQRPALTTPRP